MENLSVYRNTAIKKGLWSIRDKKENYHRILDKAITRFNEELAAIEQRCLNHEETHDAIFEAVSKSINDMHIVCEKFESAVGYNKTVKKEAQAKFREKTEYFLSKSYLFNRARTWPQGYQGDYETLECIYRNTPLSDGIGYYLDKYLLSSILSVAVRERRVTLSELLKTELENRKNPTVLDIACGSSREVFELAPEIEKSRGKIICIDFDSDALKFSADRMSYTSLSSEQIEFRKYNALRMTNHERNLREFGMQDIIYSTGLFDYLEDDVLIRLLHSLYRLISPGGSLVASFKDCRLYKTDNHWFIAWDGFMQRTEEDMWNILEKAEIPLDMLTVTREKSGVIVFFTARK